MTEEHSKARLRDWRLHNIHLLQDTIVFEGRGFGFGQAPDRQYPKGFDTYLEEKLNREVRQCSING